MQSSARQLILSRLLLAGALSAAALPVLGEAELRLVSNVTWQMPGAWFGGFSGAEVSDDGTAIALITDKGMLVRARLNRKEGTLAALQVTQRLRLSDRQGRPLTGSATDAEGLAVHPDGRAFVSFEHQHRVSSLGLSSGRTAPLQPHADFAGMQLNSGPEALAIHPDGRLYTLPERSGAPERPFPVYVRRNGQWQIVHRIPRRGPFLPVGADFDDAGRFYLLERALTPLGFRTRIRRFDFTVPDMAEQELLSTSPGRFDNMEAISLWRDPSGAVLLTLISDDNFLAVQRTQIVEYALTE